MAKIRKSISIRAPLDQVYEHTTQPDNLPEIWPSLVEVSHVKRSADGSHSFDWVYKMAGVHFKGHSATTEVVKNQRVVVKNEKGIPSTFLWAFSGENGHTKVILDIDYTLPSKLLDKLAEPLLHRINEREAETLLENLKSRMEMGVRASMPKAPPEIRPR
ncbi:MAG: SRPBCC family protein [Polyangiaceae bacterium]|nr:SRPBCC family protein [Myxococcales bacterium]MCC6899451.1 SRPBCC family protein [Polyangiaceae bacterium]